VRIGLVVPKAVQQRVIEMLTSRSVRGVEVEVISIPITVISMLTTEKLAEILSSIPRVRDVDLLIVPGACEGSTVVIEERLGIPVVKGPTHLDDLEVLLSDPQILNHLSHDEPAELAVPHPFAKRNMELLESVERCAEGIPIKGVIVPRNPPPLRIVAEVSDAHRKSVEDVVERAKKLVEDGAHIVSVGFEAWNPRPDYVKRVVSKLVDALSAPIAIDSLIPSEIRSGVEAGADMVLSLDIDNIEKVANYVRDRLCVVIPYSSARGWLPQTPAERLELVSKLIEKAHRLGIPNVVADLVLDPPIVGSPLKILYHYSLLKMRFPDIPTLVGVGNVVELADVDSIGMNALLTFFAIEVGISMLLTVEKSYKAQGSTRELATAARMATIAWIKRAPPKNIGIDLLIAKRKRP